MKRAHHALVIDGERELLQGHRGRPGRRVRRAGEKGLRLPQADPPDIICPVAGLSKEDP